MEAPRISIVCSVRNGERVLPATLESVLAQSYRDWELVVVDDGSTDGSAALVRRYAASEPRIRLIPTAGIGRAAALDLAVREARGVYVANIDADDPSHPRRLELQLEAFERSPDYALIATDHVVLLESEAPRWDAEPPSPPPAVVEVNGALRRGNPINHSSVMMRRSDLLRAGGYCVGRQRQIDYELFVRLASHRLRIGFLPLKLASHRIHAAQSFEARNRLRYLLGSLAVQQHAIRVLPGSPWCYALLPARLAWGLAPAALRGRIHRIRHADDARKASPFDTQRVRAELRSRSVRGAALSSLVQVFLIALRLGSLVILARLLTPTDFGLVAMVLAVTGVVERIRGTGLSAATVQWEELNHRQVSTLFWTNAGVSLAFALILALLGPAFVWFYDEERLLGITLAIAAGQLVDGMGLQHQALLRRQMRFGALYKVRAVGALSSRVLSIGAALLGAAYWSLVVQPVALATVTCAGAWMASGWLPGPPRRGTGVGSMLAYGRRVAGTNVIRNAARHLHDVVIGKFVGTAALGFYSRAYTVLMLPLDVENAIGVVATSGLARLQGEPARYRAFFRKALLPVVSFGMPVVAFLFVQAGDVVHTFLGPQWTEAVPILRMLAGVAFVGTFAGATHWVYLSCGRADRELRWWVFELAVQAVAVAVGLRWGLLGVAAAASAAHVMLAPAKILYCIRSSPLRLTDVLGVLWRPALSSWAAAGLLFALEDRLGGSGWPVLDLLVTATFYGLVYLACWLLLPGGAANARGLLTLAKELRVSPSSVALRS